MIRVNTYSSSLCANHCSKCYISLSVYLLIIYIFISIKSYIPCNNPLRDVPLLFPFWRWENQGTGEWDFPRSHSRWMVKLGCESNLWTPYSSLSGCRCSLHKIRKFMDNGQCWTVYMVYIISF